VPNTWFGLLPWGVEGVVIVIVGVIVFAVIVVAIIALLAWLCGFTDLLVLKDQARNFLPSYLNTENIAELSNAVLDAIDKYNELSQKKLE